MDKTTANNCIKELFKNGKLDLSKGNFLCLYNPTEEEVRENFFIEEDYFKDYRN